MSKLVKEIRADAAISAEGEAKWLNSIADALELAEKRVRLLTRAIKSYEAYVPDHPDLVPPSEVFAKCRALAKKAKANHG